MKRKTKGLAHAPETQPGAQLDGGSSSPALPQEAPPPSQPRELAVGTAVAGSQPGTGGAGGWIRIAITSKVQNSYFLLKERSHKSFGKMRH